MEDRGAPAQSQKALTSEHESSQRPPKKRAKHANPPKRRTRKRCLSQLTGMPMDVIFEIFSYLHPEDLLSMARSTKLFRGFLMRRSSVAMWRAARANVPGLPDCPKDMSEPAYASLLFTNNCTYCGKPGVQTIEWLLFARCCKACRENRSLFLATPELRDAARYFIPTFIRGKNMYAPISQVEPFFDALPEEILGERDLCIAVALHFHEKLVSLKEQVAPYKAWDEDRARNKELERDALREQRREAVWAKLSELGLGDERHLMRPSERGPIERMEGMKEPTPLTERNWEKVKDSIIRSVEGVRKRRIARERVAPYKEAISQVVPYFDEYARSVPMKEILPNGAQICMSPRVKAFIFELVENGLDTFDATQFKALIPEAVQEWRTRISKSLFQLLPLWLRHVQSDPGKALQSALVWFHSGFDNLYKKRTLPFPEVMGHKGMQSGMLLLHEPDTPEDLLKYAILSSIRVTAEVDAPNPVKLLSFDLHASFAACEIVSLCGLDPAEARHTDMDALDARIACVPCKRVFTWRKAVAHIYSPDHGGSREWVLLNDEDTAAVKRAETKHLPKTSTGTFYCTRCRRLDQRTNFEYFKGVREIKLHLRHEHDIDVWSPKQGDDYYWQDGDPCNDTMSVYPPPLSREDVGGGFSTSAPVENSW